MQTFVWLNPVAQAMYGGQDLDDQLVQHGFVQVQCSKDHIGAVKEKYRQAVRAANGCVADVRCPMAVDYIRGTYAPDGLEYPSIEPILLHCARELHAALQAGERLVVTTPCAALSAQGNALQLSNTEFVPFLQFAVREGITLSQKPLQSSPIPPGFFTEYGDRVKVLDSREEIDRYFSAPDAPGREQILELLYCPQGCHNGDGIVGGGT